MSGTTTRKTHEVFLAEVIENNGDKYVDVLSEYINWGTKVRVRYVTCGHIQTKLPSSVLKGIGCLQCAKESVGDKLRKTDSEFINKLKEVHGDSLVPLSKYEKYHGKMTFYHSVCGRVFTKTPATLFKKNGKGCTLCDSERRFKGMLATHDEFLEKLHKIYPINEFTFLEEYKGYTKPLKCVHNKCGRERLRKPSSLLTGKTCAYCSEVYSPTTKEFKERVRVEFNGEYEVVGDYKTAKTRIEILHTECGRTFLVSPDNLLRGRKCSNCKASIGEIAVRNILIERGIEFEEEKRFGGKDRNALRYDFHIPKYNAYIEYDGEQHFEAFEHWGGDEALERTQFRDRVKDANCRFRGFPLLRIPYWDFERIPEIVTEFIEELEEEQKKRKEDDLLNGEQ